MTRRFLDDIRGDLTAQLVTGGDTTAPALNALLLDMIDSVIQDESIIASNTTSLAVPTAIAWQPLTTGIYDIEVGGDGNFLKPDVINGFIETISVLGFTYEVEAKINFADLGSNTEIDFSILNNGVPVGFVASLTGGGGSRPRSASFSHIDLSTVANSQFTIGVQTIGGVNTIDIISVGLTLTIQPTNNA